jgi:hypothetical protein
MTRWQSGPQGYYDDFGLGLGLDRCERHAQLIGHHGVWGAFAFWCPELDATITGTVNTAKVDRRPLLRGVILAVTDSSRRPTPQSPRDRRRSPERATWAVMPAR